MKDVHTEHCCIIHKCKYGDDENCTVVRGDAQQSFPCESCAWQEEEYNAAIEQQKKLEQLYREGKLFWQGIPPDMEAVVENGTYFLRKKQAPKPTGKRYDSVSSLMNGEGIDKTIQEKVWRQH